jgi:hypothetical protein
LSITILMVSRKSLTRTGLGGECILTERRRLLSPTASTWLSMLPAVKKSRELNRDERNLYFVISLVCTYIVFIFHHFMHSTVRIAKRYSICMDFMPKNPFTCFTSNRLPITRLHVSDLALLMYLLYSPMYVLMSATQMEQVDTVQNLGWPCTTRTKILN